ncbi:putative coniferyl aldehyde dehydrogenase [Halopseudomonas oceani]|uniref:Aldehyde dehydrogenase n=1 Tax=Halopseudomonas oceani TaxID=1708783 RepID=A0A2P4EZV2_9GAMM|nr:coniferyl aldehyde dehydrogenase [Halopseudomonas oceani]POB06297.1 coniferyl-aldehyde dehydrogenase [Halopseudomonas oceani]GGE36566.1 putative coniferyl aldehyde dehydrogenase [Halopseudomonas oceani]
MVADIAYLQEQQQSISSMQKLFEAQRAAFRKAPIPSADDRIEHLKALKQAILKHQEALITAINEDFGRRSADETRLAEIMPSLEGIHYASKRVRRWMKPSKRKVGLAFQPAKAQVVYQPLGVIGIIVPWNYPLFLAIGPLVTALSAGNRAMIKMSESTPRTAEVLEQMLSEIFPEEQVAVVTGEADVGVAFSKLPFDHLLFTGATSIGRHVMRAAADNLTPITLELGGKSPAIISADVPLADAAERIAFGKAMNAGQTCVAPDYILCPRDRVEALAEALHHQFTAMYPSLLNNADYTQVVNPRQYQRLQSYLSDAQEKGARVLPVNPANEDLTGTRIIAPTVLLDVSDEMKVMQEEIFGPLLPILPYDQLDAALDYIADRPRPLALYYFGYDKAEQQRLMEQTHAGGMCVNDAVFHVAQDDLPFGGVGDSGMGHYHGHEGFLTMSKAKGVYIKQRYNGAKPIYPPYGGKLLKLVYKLFLR